MVADHHQTLNRLLIVGALLWASDALAQVNWPNEPAGATVLSDHNFTTCEANGWIGSCGTITSDATAPLSPPGVFEWILPVGQSSGGGEVSYTFPALVDQFYYGYWWKPTDPFYGNSENCTDKVSGFWTLDGNIITGLKCVTGRGGDRIIYAVLQIPHYNCQVPNDACFGVGSINFIPNRSSGLVSLGVWHRVETLLQRSTTGNTTTGVGCNGVFRLWLDGVLTMESTEVCMPEKFLAVFFTPTWDGSWTPDHPTPFGHTYDHVHVSVPDCGAQGCPEPTPDWPNEPSGTTELLDFAFNVTQGSGLDDVNETGVIVSDANAPLSPVNVLQSRLQNGIAPGGVLLQYDLDNLSEMFAGVWWKPNTTFQGLQSGFNRLMGFSQTESPAYLAWVGAQNAGGLSGSIQFYMPLGATAMNNCHLTGWQGNCPGEGRLLPNATACTINATDDTWHRIELYVRRSTSAIDRTGIVRWWVDGNLCGNYDPQAGTGINWGPSGLDYWFWTEAWTATPAGQSADWIHYLDHLYLSRPQGATSVDVMPPGPVTSFTVTIPGGPPPPDPPPVGISPGAEWLQFF